MDRYRYVGPDISLFGYSALGMHKDGEFLVQIDDTKHEWSRGWHSAHEPHWQLTGELI